MGFPEIEMKELAMNPDAAENGGNCGNISTGNTEKARGISCPKWGCCLDGLCNKREEKLAFNVKNASLVLNVILILIIIGISISTTLLVRSTVLTATLPSPSTPTECCPDGWIGYKRKCYYFSDSNRTWNSSQNYCASVNASLVVIDSQEEMSFLRRYKGPGDHWIGLQRIDDKEPWRWVDGTIFNSWFEIRGNGVSAYINHQGVASSSGRSEEPWICSKPVHI